MKLKLDGEGHAVLKDGMPVYVHDDGTEAAFDASSAVVTIKARNAEAKTNRERYEAAETKLKSYEGIDDPDAARKALSTVQNLDHKKLVDAGEVERLKAEINKTWQDRLDAEVKKAAGLETQLHNEIVGGSFARSKYIADKLAIPPDMVQASFGARFKVEEGKLKAYDADGNPIYSKVKAGNPADFDEAMEILVDQYPHKANILRAVNGSGSGAPPTKVGNGQNQGKSTGRAAFEGMEASARMKFIQEGGIVTESA